jgi:DNA-binding NtrC family response regulator
MNDTLVHIAVLDDDPDFLTYIEDFLKDEAIYDVGAYSKSEDLIAACEESVPEIVLLDMNMGEVKGDEVVEQLLSRWPRICVIVVTGYPSMEGMRATFKMKVYDYVAKPFTLAQLRTVLANATEAFGLGRAMQQRLRETLGQRIKLLRVERAWSLKDLAGLTRLSVSQISSIERGAHLPSIESLLSISKALEKKPSELLASIDF